MDFTSLPPDVQRVIASQAEPRTMRSLRSTSSNVNRIVQPIYRENVRQLCQNPILTDVVRYLENNAQIGVVQRSLVEFNKPITDIGYFQNAFSKLGEGSSLISTMSFGPSPRTGNYYLTYSATEINSGYNNNRIFELVSSREYILDLSTTYKILKDLPVCRQTLGPNFARETVLNRLEEIYDRYLLSPYYVDVVKFYIYLHINASQLGIPVTLIPELSEVDIEDVGGAEDVSVIKRFRDQINILYPQVYQELDRLP